MFDNRVTRFTPGQTNSKENGLFSDIFVNDRIGKIHEYSQDFDQYIAADFTLTLGGGAVAQVAGDGGIITLTTAVSAATIVQKVPAAFQLAKSLRAWGRFMVSVDSILGATILGLINATAAPFTAANITDGIYMLTDGTGAVSFILAVAGVKTTLASGVLLVGGGTFIFEWYYDGAAYSAAPAGRVVYEIRNTVGLGLTNGVTANFRGEIGGGNSAQIMPATFPGAVNLAPMVAVNATTAVARVLTVDTIYAAKDRTNINASTAF